MKGSFTLNHEGLGLEGWTVFTEAFIYIDLWRVEVFFFFLILSFKVFKGDWSLMEWCFMWDSTVLFRCILGLWKFPFEGC